MVGYYIEYMIGYYIEYMIGYYIECDEQIINKYKQVDEQGVL